MKPEANATERRHATAIVWDGHGILFTGPSGSGKSDLALRCVHQGALLLADDHVILQRQDDAVRISAPDMARKGSIEIRGIGIVQIPVFDSAAPLCALFDLTPSSKTERLPDLTATDLMGVPIPRFSLNAFHISAAAKVYFTVQAIAKNGLLHPEDTLCQQSD